MSGDADRIAGIVRRGAETPYADALVRLVIEGPQAVYGR